MKYLAVVEFQDQCYQLHDVKVVSGIKEAEALRDEIEEFDDNHAYSVSFFAFKDPESVIKKYEYTTLYPQEEISFNESGFISFIRKFDRIFISEMELFESTGLYRRKSGYCIKCGRENLSECKCKLTKDIGLTLLT